MRCLIRVGRVGPVARPRALCEARRRYASLHASPWEGEDLEEDGEDDKMNPAEIARSSSHLREQHLQKRASVAKWTGLVLLSHTPDQLAHTLFEALPEEAFCEARVWATLINIFKRHHVVDGINWVLCEMRHRQMPLTPDILGNLISAYGHLRMPLKAVRLWNSLPEVANSTGHLRAKLLSITAVALARNGRFFDREVNEAMEILSVRDPNPIQYSYWYTWGRLIHAFVLSRNMPGAERVFNAYQSLMPIKEYTPLILYNTMIRGYGDVGNLDKALKMFDEAQDVTGRIDAETEMDMVMVVSKCCGIDGAVEFLLREGSFDVRPEPFQRLLAMLLDQGDSRNAKLLFSKICGEGELADSITEEDMRAKITLSEDRLRKHPLWKKEDVRMDRRFAWVDVLLRAPSAGALEAVLRTGIAPFNRADCFRLLRRCQALGSAVGIELIAKNWLRLARNEASFWTDGFGAEVMQRLGNIRTRQIGGLTGVTVAGQAASEVARRILQQWPPLRLLELYGRGPSDDEDSSLMVTLLPKSPRVFAGLPPADLVRAVACMVDYNVFVDEPEYLECVLAAFRDPTVSIAVDTFSDVMVLLVPTFAPLDTIKMMNNGKFELSYWHKVARRAWTLDELRNAVEMCMKVENVAIHPGMWQEWAELFATRLFTAFETSTLSSLVTPPRWSRDIKWLPIFCTDASVVLKIGAA